MSPVNDNEHFTVSIVPYHPRFWGADWAQLGGPHSGCLTQSSRWLGVESSEDFCTHLAALGATRTPTPGLLVGTGLPCSMAPGFCPGGKPFMTQPQ